MEVTVGWLRSPVTEDSHGGLSLNSETPEIALALLGHCLGAAALLMRFLR